MKFYTKAMNGMSYENGKSEYLNAHFVYKGRSVIVDYELCLHAYAEHVYAERERVVPFEVYPYNGDIYVGYVELDNDFRKADMAKLISEIDEALEKEK